MSKSLTVKVKRTSLIKALGTAVTQREKRWEQQQKDTKAYELAKEAYSEALLKLIKNGKGKITEASVDEWHTRTRKQHGGSTSVVSVSMDIPTSQMPKEPKDNSEHYGESIYNREVEAIKQGIRILELSDQEYVNASTYKSVAEYL